MKKIHQLGRYEIISELGQGAMGIVYQAKDPLIDRLVAVKTIQLGSPDPEHAEYEARFYQEARAAGRLNHPNIVTIYDVGKTDEIAYIAMEFLHGRELRDILLEQKILALKQVLDIITQVALGLAYAHEHGVIHRDIKPSNIIINKDGLVKIADFGIARLESASVKTQTGMTLGTPKYMSPEQVRSEHIDRRSDVFSLGVMTYEMLTGTPPFTGDNINAIMYQTLNTLPPPPSTLATEVPEMLDFIVAKMLAKNVDDRYQRAEDLVDDLRACRDSLSTAGTDKFGVAPANRLRSDENDEHAANLAFGLSKSFDSIDATLRLAAQTVGENEARGFAKTLRLTRADKLNAALSDPAKPVVPAPLPVNDEQARPKLSVAALGQKEIVLAAIAALLSIALLIALLL